MYIRSAEFGMRHPEWAKPLSQGGSHVAPWAVVTFHEQRGRSPEVRPYRRVYPYRDRINAERQSTIMMERLEDGVIQAVAMVTRGRPEWIAGPIEIVERWIALRRGVNKGADPWVSAGYFTRKRAEDRSKTYLEQGASLSTEDRERALRTIRGERT